jgi:hypothetical protein
VYYDNALHKISEKPTLKPGCSIFSQPPWVWQVTYHLRNAMIELHTDLRGELRGLRGDVRTGFAEMRNDVHTELSELRGDFRGELSGMRTEVAYLRGRLDVLIWAVGINAAATIAILGVLLRH